MALYSKNKIPNIKTIDEWDCFMMYLRNINSEKSKQPILDFLVYKIGYEEDSARKLTTGTIGFSRNKINQTMAQSINLLFEWAKTEYSASLDGYSEFRNNFFKKHSNLPSFSYEFVGRRNELIKIRNMFSDKNEVVCLSTYKNKSSIRAKSLSGFGGQGKTAIAHQFATLHQDIYHAIIWIYAQRNTISSQVAQFVSEDEQDPIIPPYDGSKSHTAEFEYYLKKIARKYRHTLIIIDDVRTNNHKSGAITNGTKELRSLLSTLQGEYRERFDIIITSRHAILTNKLVQMSIKPMILDDAIDLFISRSKLQRLQHDNKLLKKLVDNILGCHPLSIALVATYAREHQQFDLERLISLVNDQIVDSNFLIDHKLDEYPETLYKAFNLSFTAICRDAQLLLLSLAMFPRSIISVDTLKSSIRSVDSDNPEVFAFRSDFLKRGGSSKTLNTLFNHTLIEHIIRSDQRRKYEKRYIQLHEVIFDFVQAKWVSWKNGDEHQTLKILENALTCGACNYASKQINQEKITFRDVDTLTALLIPQVREARGFIPSNERVTSALDFWFTHYKFQNFVYDTGLQETLLAQMIALREYLESTSLMLDKENLILSKLIGHAYYADPTETGEIAKNYFDKALEVARRLENRDSTPSTLKRAIHWYKIFLLDHRSNVASKNRPSERQSKEIRHDPKFESDFDEIESALPHTLLDLSAPPLIEDYELLLRAAHYWGHRGNQDSFILYKQLKGGHISHDWSDLIQATAEHYIRAMNYRILALRVFRQGAYEKYLQNHHSIYLAQWIKDAIPFKSRVGYEGFTSLHQGIGDTAHQYRGLHFVYILDYLNSKSKNKKNAAVERANEAFEAAKDLWNVAYKMKAADESPIKYRLWMCSSMIMMDIINTVHMKREIPPLKDVTDRLEVLVSEMQKELRSNYQHSAKEQYEQTRVIWEHAQKC